MSDLFWLTDAQRERLRPFFPQSRGKPRVDDRRVLSWIIFINRNGLRWRDGEGGARHRCKFLSACCRGAAVLA
jgi:transposase